MITYYLFGNFCGYFRTQDITKSHEEFEKWREEQNVIRDGSKLIDDRGNECGVILKDDKYPHLVNKDHYRGGHIKIRED